MLSLGLPEKIYFCTEPADMRKSFDGLMRMTEEFLHKDVLRGGLFVFVNKKKDRVKLLYWDVDGLAIWYKRLEEGNFQLPLANEYASISANQLSFMLQGVDLNSVRYRKRFSVSQT